MLLYNPPAAFAATPFAKGDSRHTAVPFVARAKASVMAAIKGVAAGRGIPLFQEL